MMITKNGRPACRGAEWSHQRWVTWLPPCSLYLLRKTLAQRYVKAKAGGMTPEGLVDGVKAPPGLSALSHWVSCLTWPVRPSTDQAFIPPSPAASAPNKATIWSPWISKSFSFWFPLNSACVFPLCSEWRVRFPLSGWLVNCVWPYVCLVECRANFGSVMRSFQVIAVGIFPDWLSLCLVINVTYDFINILHFHYYKVNGRIYL